MNTKRQTNDKAIKSLLKDLDLMELAVLRERLLTIGDITMADIRDRHESWESGLNHLIDLSVYKNLCYKIDKHLGF